MMRLSSSFARERELIIVEAEISGPATATEARLVLDTGAAATTLVPEVIERIGYTQRDSFKKAKVHTAVSEEKGYWIRVAEFTVLGVTTPDFALAVFPLGHQDIDGLVGMNFLRHFNFEIRPAERRILVELINPCHDASTIAAVIISPRTTSSYTIARNSRLRKHLVAAALASSSWRRHELSALVAVCGSRGR